MKQLIRLALRQMPAAATAGPPSQFAPPAPAPPPPPEDATTLARASLLRIQGKVRKALAGEAVTDATSRAHLQETDARVTATLAAQIDRRVE